jgi:3-hydroxybutyryl-CoA dehydrogenase
MPWGRRFLINGSEQGVGMTDKITVIGPGTMGTGIAQAFLEAGFEVVLIGRSEDSLQRGLSTIKSRMEKAIAKGKMTQDEMDSVLERLKLSTDYDDGEESTAVIEAVSEVIEAKKEVFRLVEEHISGAIIATNTSSIPISELSEALSDRSGFIGMHFFNPVPVMKPVEVIIGKDTSEATRDAAIKLIERCGKVPIAVNDYPGFVANSVLMPMLNEAIILLEKGVATKEGIDTIIKLGLNHPMGPLELADYIGLDVCKDIMDSIYGETKDEKFKPAKMLNDLVSEGKLGRKSGEGFYSYKK